MYRYYVLVKALLNGNVVVFAGIPGSQDYNSGTGDGGPATSAKLSSTPRFIQLPPSHPLLMLPHYRHSCPSNSLVCLMYVPTPLHIHTHEYSVVYGSILRETSTWFVMTLV